MANIYIEYFDEISTEILPQNPTMWPQCIDDIFIFWLHQDEQAVLDHMNSISFIQFIMEKKADQLTFLDILLTFTVCICVSGKCIQIFSFIGDKQPFPPPLHNYIMGLLLYLCNSPNGLAPKLF